MSTYVLVTNFYNGDDVVKLLDQITLQTELPVHWIFIDDGSPNPRREEVITRARDLLLPVSYIQASNQKVVGNKHKIGRAWTVAFDLIKSIPADYLGIMDVDNVFHPSYFSFLMEYLDESPHIGAVSGSVKGEKRMSHMPMGGGKLVRWEVLESIDEFWDLAPDTFLNIKSMALDFMNDVLPNYHVEGSDTTTERRGVDLAYRLHYCGNSILTAIVKALRLRDLSVLTKFIGFRLRRERQCQDPDVRWYYSKRRILKTFRTKRMWLL